MTESVYKELVNVSCDILILDRSSSDFFDSSLEAIRNTLSDADRMSFRRFATPKEMIAEIRLIMRKHENKSRLAACCRRIDAFSKAFEPYFDVIGIFVRSNRSGQLGSGE